MSEPKPKWQRGLFWISILAGVIALTLVAGFFVGKWFYRTTEYAGRPGFGVWSRVYQRILFMEADTKGYRYSDLGKEHWLNARYVYDPHDKMPGGGFFVKADGGIIVGVDARLMNLEVYLDDGAQCRVKVELDWYSNADWGDWLADDLKWYLTERVIEVKELKDE